jgi:hypothetical protein
MDGVAQTLIGATTIGALFMALAGAHPESPAVRYRAAMESYQAHQWPQAWEELASLADDGDAAAARVAAMMARQGPVLFGQHFDASPERLARWQRTMRGDSMALAGPGARHLALTSPGTGARTAGLPPVVRVAHAE